MSGSEHARPIWLDSLGADTLRYYAARAESTADQAFFYGLADAWDAAPADSEEVVGATLEAEFEVEITDEHLAVLRALGHPKAPA